MKRKLIGFAKLANASLTGSKPLSTANTGTNNAVTLILTASLTHNQPMIMEIKSPN
ncbi:MAG: hypothetical protein HOA43_05225 [Acidiferrobacteraceae bacterium]|nr:hypothetical protein [Acidiferrobacteraceae bacterium]